MRRRSFVPILAIALTATASATATTPNACGDAYVGAQRLSSAGKFVAARAQLTACLKACTGTFREECGEWLRQVEPRIPSIVVRAVDPDGNDLNDVRVSIDGVISAESLEGKPFDLDVGQHQVRFEHHGHKPITRDIVAVDGEQRRPLLVRFEPLASTAPAAPMPSGPSVGSSTLRTIGGIALGIGAVGIVTSGITGLMVIGAGNERGRVCTPACVEGSFEYGRARDLNDKGRTLSLVSTVAFAAGAVLALGGLYLLLTKTSGADAKNGQVAARRAFDHAIVF